MPQQSPVPKDLDQYAFPAFDPEPPQRRRSFDYEDTLENDSVDEYIDKNNLYVHPSYERGPDHINARGISPASSSQQQLKQSQQLDDELEMLRAETTVQQANEGREREKNSESLSKTLSISRTKSRQHVEPEDDFDIGSTPVYEQAKAYQPPSKPATRLAKLFIRIHSSSFILRYICYITPVALILLIPLLLGAFKFTNQTVGDVELMWFCIWLEIFWLTLWLGRIIAICIPYLVGLVASIFTNTEKMWRDLARQLEVPIALFFWWLAVEISFLPTMKNHHADGDKATRGWEVTMNKVIVSIFVGVTLNFVEKIIIQLIAISFHLRTYADRIEINKFQSNSLMKLYVYSKEKITMQDSEFEAPEIEDTRGFNTPLKYINRAGKGAKQAFHKVGDVAGKVAGDFTGRSVMQSTHPQQVILQLLSSTSGSQVLARRLHRTFAPQGAETFAEDDLRPAFDNNEEAEAAFNMFDKDMNGDISMEELEASCVEIGRERKAITASLKDLDSVVSKLDDLFLFIVAIITILVFISLISTSAAGVLTSAGSAVLALSWLFSATAQEVLQSIVFVFIKHPFDVGDRVTIYGNTGTTGLGDDYFVKEIALLFTEFKKMEGHVVQAPNSYLNTLFILNQRRSGGLAEAVPVTMKFGTTIEQLEGLRATLLEFVGSENREYQHNILTELKTVYEAYSISMNVVFFYKSNWQNELLRLQRRNKFICALMVAMQDLGIEGPRRTWAGQNPSAPVYMTSNPPIYSPPVVDQPPPSPPKPTAPPTNISTAGPTTRSFARQPSTASEVAPEYKFTAQPSILRHRTRTMSRDKAESVNQMSKRVDFSLGMSSISSGADLGDIYDKPRVRVPVIREPGRSRSPDSDRHRDEERGEGESLGREGSRESEMRRRSHRHLFGRKKGSLAEKDDLEAAVGGGAVQMSEMGGGEQLPRIPEVEGPSRSSGSVRGRAGSDAAMVEEVGGRMHPRTGLVGRRAVVEDDTDEERESRDGHNARRLGSRVESNWGEEGKDLLEREK